MIIDLCQKFEESEKITYAFFDYTFFSNSITFNAGEAYLKMLSNSSSLFTENAFPESREEALEKEDNYIDFQVIGKNQNKDKKIWYRLSIINDAVNGSYKIPDEYIAFDLTDTTDPLYPIEIIKNGRLSDYKRNGIYVDFLDEYVNSDVTKTRSFRVRIWIAEEMIISDTVAGAAFSATKREYYEPSYVFPNSELPAYSEANSMLKIECYARDEEIETPFAYMKYATAHILSSYSEGLPTVLIESMAVETLNIASSCPNGPREILMDGKAGLLFKPGNVDELAQHMTNVYNKNIDINSMVNVATKSLKRFSTAIIIKKITNLF